MADQTPATAPVSYPASSTTVVGTRVVRDTATATKPNARRTRPKVSTKTHRVKGR